MVVECQVDEFTCTWSMECFIAQSYISPWFCRQGVDSNPLHPWIRLWELILFGPAVKDFEHRFGSLPMDSVSTPELVVSFNEADAIHSSVSWRTLCLMSTHSDNTRLQLSSGNKCGNYGAKLGHYFYLYHRLVKCQPLNSSFLLSSSSIWIPGFFATW